MFMRFQYVYILYFWFIYYISIFNYNIIILLSDPSPIIGDACQRLTNYCLVNLTDVTLACIDANLILVEAVTVADVDDENCVGNSLLQIWTLTFGPKATLLFRL